MSAQNYEVEPDHCRKGRTNLANYFVILKNSPSNVDTVILPVRLGHVLIDIGIDPGHDASVLWKSRGRQKRDVPRLRVAAEFELHEGQI